MHIQQVQPYLSFDGRCDEALAEGGQVQMPQGQA